MKKVVCDVLSARFATVETSSLLDLIYQITSEIEWDGSKLIDMSPPYSVNEYWEKIGLPTIKDDLYDKIPTRVEFYFGKLNVDMVLYIDMKLL